MLIEGGVVGILLVAFAVTTRAVVWIEIIGTVSNISAGDRSPPVRWCGLKSSVVLSSIVQPPVTTRAVVWIEIVRCLSSSAAGLVTTRAVVWIEIPSRTGKDDEHICHHPCGGVD